MPLGPGKYDEACIAAREATEARALVLIVFDGKEGHGFEFQQIEPSEVTTRELVRVLRRVADQIERDVLA